MFRRSTESSSSKLYSKAIYYGSSRYNFTKYFSGIFLLTTVKSRDYDVTSVLAWVGDERNMYRILVGEPLRILRRKTAKKMEDRININVMKACLRITDGWT